MGRAGMLSRQLPNRADDGAPAPSTVIELVVAEPGAAGGPVESGVRSSGYGHEALERFGKRGVGGKERAVPVGPGPARIP